MAASQKEGDPRAQSGGSAWISLISMQKTPLLHPGPESHSSPYTPPEMGALDSQGACIGCAGCGDRGLHLGMLPAPAVCPLHRQPPGHRQGG